MPAVRESATRSSRDRRVKIWIDAQLSPGLARWIRDTFGIDAQAVRDVGLRSAKDPVIFKAAREAKVVVMSKDEDFRALVERLGPPPQVLWVTCGNTSNARLREILTKSLLPAMELLQRGEPLVEISDVYVPPRGGTRLTRRSTRPRPRRGSGKRERSRSGRSRCAGALDSNLKEDHGELLEGRRKQGRRSPAEEPHNDSNHNP